MMKQTIRHGAELDMVTPAEMQEFLRIVRERDEERMFTRTFIAEVGKDDRYEIPTGYYLHIQAVTFESDANTPIGIWRNAVQFGNGLLLGPVGPSAIQGQFLDTPQSANYIIPGGTVLVAHVDQGRGAITLYGRLVKIPL